MLPHSVPPAHRHAVMLQISKYAKLEKKPVDDVLGGEEAWKNVQKTDSKQLQDIRSDAADEGCLQRKACRAVVSAVKAWTSFAGGGGGTGRESRLGYCCSCAKDAVSSDTRPCRCCCCCCCFLCLPACLLAVTCGNCSAGQAYFMEVQIRSADEPATIFYKCVECAHLWREG